MVLVIGDKHLYMSVTNKFFLLTGLQKKLVTATFMSPSLIIWLSVTGIYRCPSLNNFLFHPVLQKNTSDSQFYEPVTSVLY